MRHSVVLLTTIVVVVSCGISRVARAQSQAGADQKIASGEQKTSTKPPLEYLLDSAAADFHSHPPHPARFRHVRFGYRIGSDGTKQYRLCGEFLPENKGNAKWLSFATLRTSGYEQYLGEHGLSFCKESKIIWDKDDLSSSLQSRFDAMP